MPGFYGWRHKYSVSMSVNTAIWKKQEPIMFWLVNFNIHSECATGLPFLSGWKYSWLNWTASPSHQCNQPCRLKITHSLLQKESFLLDRLDRLHKNEYLTSYKVRHIFCLKKGVHYGVIVHMNVLRINWLKIRQRIIWLKRGFPDV